MIFGMSTLTFVHTLLSLIALVAGLVVVFGLLDSRTLPLWTALFLLTAVVTSVTGFVFPFEHFLPSHWFGVISLVAFAVAILARYVSIRRSLALALRADGASRHVPLGLRHHRAGIPEDSGSPRVGPDTVGAAVWGVARRDAGRFRRADRHGDPQVSCAGACEVSRSPDAARWAAPRRLTRRMSDILFIKTSSLGDVIHQMPALTEARRHLPQARFSWVVEEAFAPLVRLHPAVSEVIPVATRRWRQAFFEPVDLARHGTIQRARDPRARL